MSGLSSQDRVAGRYVLRERLLDAPGYVEWRALDEEVGVEVGLWLFRERLFDVAGLVGLIESAAAVRSLGHPNIRKLFELGCDGALGFATWQLAIGEPPPLIPPHAPLDDVGIARVVQALASGLASAHDEGMVHGRLVPADLVSVGGVLKIAGMGIYAGASPAVASAAWQGAQRYLSPEVRRGYEPTVTADVYSLAVIATECAAARAADNLKIALAAVSARHGQLAALLAAATNDDVTVRPQSVLELSTRLSTVLGVVLSAPPTVAATAAPAFGLATVDERDIAFARDVVNLDQRSDIPRAARATLDGRPVHARATPGDDAATAQFSRSGNPDLFDTGDDPSVSGPLPIGELGYDDSVETAAGNGRARIRPKTATVAGHGGALRERMPRPDSLGDTDEVLTSTAERSAEVTHEVTTERQGEHRRLGGADPRTAGELPPGPTGERGGEAGSAVSGYGQADGQASGSRPLAALELGEVDSEGIPLLADSEGLLEDYHSQVVSLPVAGGPPERQMAAVSMRPAVAAPAKTPIIAAIEKPGMRPKLRSLAGAAPHHVTAAPGQLGFLAPPRVPTSAAAGRSGRLRLLLFGVVIAALGGGLVFAAHAMGWFGEGNNASPTRRVATSLPSGSAAVPAPVTDEAGAADGGARHWDGGASHADDESVSQGNATQPSPSAVAPSPLVEQAPVGEALEPVASGSAQADCPRDMVAVGSAACIDVYESPGRGRLPQTGLTAVAAAGECTARGMRLCTGKEWEAACRGERGASFPYGTSYRPDFCRLRTSIVETTGSAPLCVSAAGAYDMSGNVAEWVAGGAIRGGSATDGTDGRCSRDAQRKGANRGYSDVGFRCCGDRLGSRP